MIGAIEFLRKAKVICNANEECMECVVFDLCHAMPMGLKCESELVRKVMDYEINKEPNESDNEKEVAKKEEKEIVTKGEVIRESNESLAKFIRSITRCCITDDCEKCVLIKACTVKEKPMIDYLNQEKGADNV